jgi:hypothetical protein
MGKRNLRIEKSRATIVEPSIYRPALLRGGLFAKKPPSPKILKNTPKNFEKQTPKILQKGPSHQGY